MTSSMRRAEHGLTNWYGINIGTGQGCVNGATRAKLALALTQRTINKLCKGYAFATDEQRRITSLWYCDDACLLSASPQELLLMMECCWMIAQMSGLKVTIKGKKKTAWMGTYWDTNEQGCKVEKDIVCGETWKMEFPGGEEIPQIMMGEEIDYYKHLGSELTSGWGGGQDDPGGEGAACASESAGGWCAKRLKRKEQRPLPHLQVDAGCEDCTPLSHVARRVEVARPVVMVEAAHHRGIVVRAIVAGDGGVRL